MDIFDLGASKEFSPDHHVYKFLAETPYCSISVVGWEPGQTSPVHSHPTADEIYHVLEGEGRFNDGRREVRLKAGDTVIFPAGEVHQVTSVTRMVLYRVQAGADRAPKMADGWPGWKASRVPGVSVKVLRHDEATGASTSLVRFTPGTRFPAHTHPAGEEIYVVEGDFQVGPHRLRGGDYLYTPPDGKHAASTEGGCVVLVTLPRPVEFL